jgi:hypothetical protein
MGGDWDRCIRKGKEKKQTQQPSAHITMTSSSTNASSSSSSITEAEEFKNQGNDAFRKVHKFCLWYQGNMP